MFAVIISFIADRWHALTGWFDQPVTNGLAVALAFMAWQSRRDATGRVRKDILDQALRHHAPNVPGGEVSKDMMGARSAAEHKLLIDLASVADGHSAQLRGHCAKTGLSVRCELDHKAYPKGVTVSDEDMAALNIHRDTFHGEWNYTIKPHEPENNAVVL